MYFDPVLYVLCICDSGEELNEVNIVQVSKWLLCVHKSLEEFADNASTLTELKTMKLLPLTNGRVTSASVDTVFFPVSAAVEKRGCYMLLLIFISQLVQ